MKRLAVLLANVIVFLSCGVSGSSPCLSNPCNAGLICVSNTYTYGCYAPVFSTLTSTTTTTTTTTSSSSVVVGNPCASNPCSNQYLCVPLLNNSTFACVCVFTSCYSTSLQTTVTTTASTTTLMSTANPCTSSPCGSNFLCVPLLNNSTYICICVSGICSTTQSPATTTTTKMAVSTTTVANPCTSFPCTRISNRCLNCACCCRRWAARKSGIAGHGHANTNVSRIVKYGHT